jgi:hypothetical protein
MSSATLSSAAVIDGTATIQSREWWRREAARLGFDWNGVMEMRASVGPLACRVCGAVRWSPSFCAACRLANQQAPWMSQREMKSCRETSRMMVPDEHTLMRLVRRIAEARLGERNKLTYWAACRLGEMVASGLLDANFAAAIIAEAATRAGLSLSEAERTAWNGIRRSGGPHA